MGTENGRLDKYDLKFLIRIARRISGFSHGVRYQCLGGEEFSRRECLDSGICPLVARTVFGDFFFSPNRRETRKGHENKALKIYRIK